MYKAKSLENRIVYLHVYVHVYTMLAMDVYNLIPIYIHILRSYGNGQTPAKMVGHFYS